MARRSRYDLPGSWHHVFHRGARRLDIFEDERDRRTFLSIAGRRLPEYGVEIHAYALMGNHYHLLVRSRDGCLSKGMQQTNWRFARYYNERHDAKGPLFGARYRNVPIRNLAHLFAALAYVHRNPLEAGLISDLRDPWPSSHRAYLGLEPVPTWLSTRWILEQLGGPAALHRYVSRADLSDADLEGLKAPTDDGEPCGPAMLLPIQPEEDLDTRLARIVALTGCDLAELSRSAAGRRGNPARRFAIWALSRGGRWSHAEIGRALGTTADAVAQARRRLKGTPPVEPLRSWMRAWEAGEAGEDALAPAPVSAAG